MDRTASNPNIRERGEIHENLRHITEAISQFMRIGSKIDRFGDLSYEKLAKSKSAKASAEINAAVDNVASVLDGFDSLSKELFELTFSNARQRIVEITGEDPIFKMQFDKPLESLGQAGRVDHPEHDFFLADHIMIDEYGTMVLASPHTDEWMAMPPEADFKITLEDWRASLEASEKQ